MRFVVKSKAHHFTYDKKKNVTTFICLLHLIPKSPNQKFQGFCKLSPIFFFFVQCKEIKITMELGRRISRKCHCESLVAEKQSMVEKELMELEQDFLDMKKDISEIIGVLESFRAKF
ncbi:hypothetical protein Bca4012_045242 [Brassica carinata]